VKIYHSAEYHDDSQSSAPYYKLAVINMWDFASKINCVKYGIAYKLDLCTPLDNRSTKHEQVKELSDEQKSTLEEMGYLIA